MGAKVLEISHVAPPEGSVLPATIPLTFFDLVWLSSLISTERVFLFGAPRCSTSVFLRSHLAGLKRSLSLALQRFHPLAGRLVQDSLNPHIRYSDGDSVALTVAESDDDPQDLASDGPREVDRLRQLIPNLEIISDETPVAAVQVTIFPEKGISVGVSVLHAAMDGSSFIHFVKTWASICKAKDAADAPEIDLPVLDRSLIPDPRRVREAFISMLELNKARNPPRSAGLQQPEIVRCTFRVTSRQLGDLRRRTVDQSTRCSSFTLAAALVWTCLLKARGHPPKEIEWFLTAVDCRGRYDPPIPASYFGNCLGVSSVGTPGGELVNPGGLAKAVAVVAEELRRLEEGGAEYAVRQLEKAVDNPVAFRSRESFTVASSPRFGVYRVDFGWGRPTKVEVVSITAGRVMSLAENSIEGGGGGGLEIGLALPASAMEEFASAFDEALRTCSGEAS